MVKEKVASGNDKLKDKKMNEKFQRLALVGKRQVMRAVVRARRRTGSTYGLVLMKMVLGELR